MKLSPDFHTKWALVWAKNYRDFSATEEILTRVNVRDVVCEAQREFERHLSVVMNYGDHQPLY